MKWFFVLNSNADRWFGDMLEVAVSTARKFTPLEPHCIYDGDIDGELPKKLIEMGVKIHQFRVPFFQELFSKETIEKNAGSNYSAINASGIYLKLFIPEFCEGPEEKFIFTDCDVMFTEKFRIEQIESLCGGDFFAVGESTGGVPSGDGKINVFNSGVFVTSAGFLAAARVSMLETLRKNFYFFWGRPGFYDQGLLNIEFAGRWTAAPPVLNWRPFWGDSSNAMIIHYHGAKPVQMERILAGKPSSVESDTVIQLVNGSRNEYLRVLNMYRNELGLVRTEAIDAGVSGKSLGEKCAFMLGEKNINADKIYGIDYLSELSRIFQGAAPTKILEWGAGCTTLLFSQLVDRSKARIVSIDDNEAYMKAVMEAIPADVNIEAYACSRMGLGRSQSDPELHYSSFPVSLAGKYDFIYIDGRRRVECAVHSLLCCDPNATIVIHDHKRARYQAIKAFFDVIDDGVQFLVLKPNSRVFDAVRDTFKNNKVRFESIVDGVSIKKVR